ncbi:hypothetical protein MTO96_042158 [Rhipicephalus appendiculatus]
MPPRIQHFRIRFLQSQFHVKYVPVLLDDFRAHQAADWKRAQLKSYCEKEWPRKENMPLIIVQFWVGRAEVSIVGHVLTRASSRKHVLVLIHDGHLGVNHCRAIAKGGCLETDHGVHPDKDHGGGLCQLLPPCGSTELSHCCLL